MITEDQLGILRDMLSQYDDDWLKEHISIRRAGHIDLHVLIHDVSGQDVEHLGLPPPCNDG